MAIRLKTMQKEEIRQKIRAGYIPSFLFAVAAIMIVSALGHNDTTLSVGWITHDVWVKILYALDVVLIISLLPFIRTRELKINAWLLMAPVILLLFMNVISPYDATRMGISSTLLYVAFCVTPKEIQRRAFKFFRMMWVIVCVAGIFCYLCHILNIPVPHAEVPYYFGSSKLHYINYNIAFIYDTGGSLRLCGICNEPGYFGTFCALMLCAGTMDIKKRSNWVILIAGLLSFSVAFIMIVMLYALLSLLIKARREKSTRRKVFQCIGVLLAVVAVFVVLPNIETGNQYIDRTLKRLAITSEGVAGDNRTSKQFDELYNSVPFYELIFGKGRGYTKVNGISATSSYKTYILECGIVGSLLMWGTLLAAVLCGNTKDKRVILFIIVFFASIYQRPSVITLPYLVLLAGGIEYIKGCVSVNKARRTKELSDGVDDEEKPLKE